MTAPPATTGPSGGVLAVFHDLLALASRTDAVLGAEDVRGALAWAARVDALPSSERPDLSTLDPAAPGGKAWAWAGGADAGGGGGEHPAPAGATSAQHVVLRALLLAHGRDAGRLEDIVAGYRSLGAGKGGGEGGEGGGGGEGGEDLLLDDLAGCCSSYAAARGALRAAGEGGGWAIPPGIHGLGPAAGRERAWGEAVAYFTGAGTVWKLAVASLLFGKRGAGAGAGEREGEGGGWSWEEVLDGLGLVGEAERAEVAEACLLGRLLPLWPAPLDALARLRPGWAPPPRPPPPPAPPAGAAEAVGRFVLAAWSGGGDLIALPAPLVAASAAADEGIRGCCLEQLVTAAEGQGGEAALQDARRVARHIRLLGGETAAALHEALGSIQAAGGPRTLDDD